MLAAIPLVIAGAHLLQETARFGPARAHLYGGLLLLGGALLFGALARKVPCPEVAFDVPARPVSPLTRPDRWMFSWTALALALAAYTMLRFVRAGEDRLVEATWLASVLALFVGQRYSRSQVARPPRSKVGMTVVLLLLAVALASRLHHLGTLPYNLDGDYADFGLQARAIALGEEKRLFAYGWAAIPLIGFLPAALTMQIAGTGLTGLYLAGVIEGVLVIVAVYLFGRDLFGLRAGLLAAALMTISYTHLHFSRTCAYIDPVFFTVWALYLLVRALRFGSGLPAVASGALTALDLQMYYSGRSVVILAALTILLVVCRGREWLRTRWRELVLFLLATMIVLGPMLLLFERDRDAFTSRSREVLIFTPPVLQHMKAGYRVNSLAAVLAEQGQRAALLFWTYTDASTQFGARRAFLDGFSGIALALGIGFAVFTLRRLGSAMSLGWLLAIQFLGCFLTVNPPFFPRLVILVVPAALLGGAALDRLAFSVEALPSRRSRLLGSLGPGFALAIAFTVTGISNWTWYVRDFATWATSGAHLARYLAARPAFRAYSVAIPSWWALNREFRFLAPGRLIGDLDPSEVEQGRFNASDTLVLSGDRAPLVAVLRSRFPDAVVETHPGNSPDEVAFYVFRRSGAGSETGGSP
jgi:hypothetical protein